MIDERFKILIAGELLSLAVHAHAINFFVFLGLFFMQCMLPSYQNEPPKKTLSYNYTIYRNNILFNSLRDT